MKKLILFLFILAPFHISNAQQFAVKSNLLSYLTLSPNLCIDLVANRHLSFALNGTVRPWSFPGDEMSFAVVNPQIRYWFQRPLCRLFVGVEGVYIDNDIKIKDTGYKGDCKGAGLLVGYDWVLSSRWNLEASIGCGAVYANQYKYEGVKGQFDINYKKWIPMLTSCSLSFIYIIK